MSWWPIYSRGMEMRITNTTDVIDVERKRPGGTDIYGRRTEKKGAAGERAVAPGEAALGKTVSDRAVSGKAVSGKKFRSGGVQDKLHRAADGATVDISAQGLIQKEEAEENASIREQNEKQMYQEMLENTKEAAEKQGEGFGDLAKALEIARRILNGDIVPAQDEKFLMEFNSEMYMRVKSMAELKEDPEKYDSLLEEEEEENGKSGSGSSGGAKCVSGAGGAQPEDGAAASEGTPGPDGALV